MEKAGYSLLLDMIPDEMFIRCQARADAWSRDKWIIGDDTNFIKNMVNDNLIPISTFDIYECVAFMHNYEFTGRTVEYYARVAEFFKDDLRKKYEVLSFARFNLALQYGDRWQEILDLSLEYMDTHNGKLSSERWIRAKMNGYIEEQQDIVQNEAVDSVVLSDPINNEDLFVNSDGNPIGIYETSDLDFMYALENGVRTLYPKIPDFIALGVDADTVQDLRDAINQFVDASMRIKEELEEKERQNAPG